METVAVEAAGLDEIVVSARRRDENLQKTPVSISAFAGAQLERAQATNVMDIADLTPNLRKSAGPQGGSSGHYFIRGVGQLDFIASTDPGVGTYLDGVYLGRTTGAAFDLLDVQRIEVLRGPQGTLFGRNAIGGVINVVSVLPQNDAEGQASLTVGSRDRIEARAKYGGSVIAGRLQWEGAVLARTQDGWQRRLVDDDVMGDERTYAGRLAVQWQPDDATNVVIACDATRTRGTGDPNNLIDANAARGGRPEYVLADPELTWAGQRSRDDLDVEGAAITLTRHASLANFKTITAYRELDSNTGADFDGSPHDDLDQRVVTHQRQFSQEIQLNGEARNGDLEWLVGLYYFSEGVIQAIPVTLMGTVISQNNDLDNRSGAVFTHWTYQFSPRVSFSGGVRYTVETKRHSFNHYLVLPAGPEPLFAPTTLDDRWQSTTPKLGVELQATKDALFYASASQGFRSGGFNGRPFGSEEFLAYEPETLTTLEVGAKSEWLQRRVRLNAAMFVSRYHDIQLTRTTIGTSGVPIVVTGNAGEAELSGGEIELTVAPDEQWRYSSSLGYLHDKYTELAPGTAVTVANKLPVSPQWTINASIENAQTILGRLKLRSRIDYSYTSAFNYLFDNPELSWERACGLWNLSMALESPGDRWELGAYLLNATDRQHSDFREDVRASFGVALDWPARPREWGLKLRYRFGD